MQYIHLYDSPLGDIIMSSDGTFLTGLWFFDQKHVPVFRRSEIVPNNLPVFDSTVLWLNQYFGGCIPDFTPEISLNGTIFQNAVWTLLLAIPYGSTVSYGQLAKEVSRINNTTRMSA